MTPGSGLSPRPVGVWGGPQAEPTGEVLIHPQARQDQPRADFYAERFRGEFKPAFDAWLATKPLANPDAPPSPFEMAEYRVALRDRAAQKEVAAADASAEGV